MPSTPSPAATTRPTPSTPRILGFGVSFQAMPWRTPMSMKLTPAKAVSTSAWPGPATGSGRSTYSNISRPPVPFITMAFIGFSYLERLFRNSPKKGRLSQRPERHVGEAGQRRVVGAAASGDANTGNIRDQELGDRLGIETGGNIALPLRIADAADDGGAQGSCQRRPDLHQVRAGGAELIDRARAEARLVRCLDHPAQHRIDSVNGAHAAAKRLEMLSTFAHSVATHRRAIELPLVTEGGVEALPPDPHGVDEHLGRAALEAVLPKDADRAVECCIRIEFPRSCHETHIAFQERSVKNCVDDRASAILALSC